MKKHQKSHKQIVMGVSAICSIKRLAMIDRVSLVFAVWYLSQVQNTLIGKNSRYAM